MLQINFDPFPNLETERLSLRRLDESDVNEIFILRSDAQIMKYIPRPLAKNKQEALEHISTIDSKIKSNEGINWAITLKGNTKLIGIIGFYRIDVENYRAEIGYILNPQYNGNGMMTEAVKKVLEHGFTSMQLHSVEAIIAPDNIASSKVLEKNGFVKEAHLKQNHLFEGRFLDTVIYSLLNK